MKAFKAYDIRGIWGVDLTEEIAYRIGYFIPEIFKVNEIIIGRDIRNSSNAFFDALANGITDAGANIKDAGLATTPMIYWATGKLNAEFSIMITASHNSKQYNGLKFSGKGVAPIGYDNGLNNLEEIVESSKVTTIKKKGKIEKVNIKPDYLKFLKSYIKDFSGLNIVIDCSNGMANLFAKEIFGNTHKYINDTLDGNFPGHEPNPLNPKNQKQIKNEVIENGCDFGIIYDGDADRVMFIDEQGNFISPDLIIALLALYFFDERNENGPVVQDIRTSKAVGDYLKKYDTELVIWKVGRAFGATKLKELDGIYGGELAGHYYFRDFYYSDSGLLASIIVTNIISKIVANRGSFSEIMKSISSYSNTGEVNFTIENKQYAMDKVLGYFKNNDNNFKFYDFDGYRLEFADWWFNIRPSNTEPYLRFLAEASSLELLEEKTGIIYDILNKCT